MFYVYEWYIIETNEVFYVGKGSKKRYLSKQHNNMFKEFLKRFDCKSRIVKYYNSEEEAFNGEYERILELKGKGQCVCNIYKGGYGGETQSWTLEKKKKYSENNVMKSEKQRERMRKNNPMKNKKYAMKNGLAHRKPFFVGDKEFQTLEEAAKYFDRKKSTVKSWLKKGSRFKEKCYYKYK